MYIDVYIYTCIYRSTYVYRYIYEIEESCPYTNGPIMAKPAKTRRIQKHKKCYRSGKSTKVWIDGIWPCPIKITLGNVKELRD